MSGLSALAGVVARQYSHPAGGGVLDGFLGVEYREHSLGPDLTGRELMPERSYRVVLWSLVLLGLAADQATKYGVFHWLQGVDGHTYALFQTEPEKRWFSIVPAERDEVRAQQRGFFLAAQYEKDARDRTVPRVNQGALFSLWREHKEWANGGFAIVSLLAAAAVVYWSTQKKTARDRWLCTSLGLILAGTLGNFYDRIVFNGVRDFLHWNYLYKDYEGWPVFNIADCCLVVGACLLLAQAFFAPARQPDKKKSQDNKASVAVPVGSSS
jgi:lipoprotein signal peptidase